MIRRAVVAVLYGRLPCRARRCWHPASGYAVWCREHCLDILVNNCHPVTGRPIVPSRLAHPTRDHPAPRNY